jgi:hypothetical protein
MTENVYISGGRVVSFGGGCASNSVVGLQITTTSPLPTASVGNPYSTTIVATGGTAPYTWAITANTPNTGSWSSINSITGALGGTPGTAETESITVQVTDSATPTPNQVSKVFSLTVGTALVLTQAESFTITGSSFGTKSRAVGPLVFDTGADAPAGSVSPQWATAPAQPVPNGFTGGQANYNMQNQTPGFSPTGADIGAPNSFITNILAGCHFESGANSGQDVAVNCVFDFPGYPFCARWEYYWRCDPNWTVDPNSDNNLKDLNYGQGNQPYPTVSGEQYYWYSAFATSEQYGVNEVITGTTTTLRLAAQQGGNPYTTGQYATLSGFLGITQLNGQIVPITAGGSDDAWTVICPINSTSYSPYQASLALSNITQADPCVITLSSTSSTHPLSAGTWISFSGVGGMTQINGLSAYIFSTSDLGGSSGAWTASLNNGGGYANFSSSSFSAYTSGGVIYSGAANKQAGNYTVSENYGTDAADQPTDLNPMFQYPDANGHNTRDGSAMLYPMNPANGWIKRRVEMCITTTAGLSGGGYCRVYDNGVNIYNYAGSTDNVNAASQTTRCLSMGNFSRDRGANNYRYLCQGYYDATASGVTGQCAAVYVGNASTLAACTILEPQVCSSWSNTSITGTFWQGNLSAGTAYVYVMRETDASGTALAWGTATIS